MRITDLLKKEGILLNVSPASRDEAYDILIDLQAKLGNISDKEEYKRGIFEREAQCTTAIGEGLAIPHAKNKAVKKPGLVAITVPGGVDCNSMDQAPTNLIFMIAAPEGGSDIHLEVLANLNKILMDPTFRAKLLAAKNPEEFMKIVDQKETEKFGGQKMENTGFRILAVTACPTGIAHTFMAAEALELKGKELGYALKAETNGSGGAQNVLTKEEIAKADGIIIAADKNVEMARFDGKKVLKVKVSDGISKPQELIEKVISGNVPVYHHEGGAEEESGQGEGVGRQIYKHLMNGVSNMLPFVIGGGILIALAFLLDVFDPNKASSFGSGTPIAALFMTIGGTAFSFMLPVLAGYIAMSIADRPGLAVGFVGGMLAKLGASISFSGGALVVVKEGVSPGFLGALIAGFVGGFIVLGLKKLFSKMPKSLEGIKPVLIYPVAGIFLVGIVMLFINPYVGNINTAMTNGLNTLGSGNMILLGIVVAGMMSVDMGGPINKAAYVFGTATLFDAAGGSVASPIMAAVMVGGMVPPLVIALSTTFFRNKWTKQQREAGFVNYIMGLCFISEGAIPFAAADPIRVIPSCIIGSAVAGAISVIMNCTLRAPHGGVFVFGVVGNTLGYVVALLVGSVVGAIILTTLKKPIKNM
ncbi:PTS fructose transporter subunit IIABC [[Clostridium] fimetarium]|uniref:PTS system, fructose-specific IIC component n=1 Tax=[Clostridium] fimetarium TaxID=99656 RepID=A0A1I0R2K7_9FIRM|nr:PTS fructose transporter subunit IIABC [[Clostridium] fimetarium]SEW34699.1 PTS system, fructose-specific IIC component [[Clostridium] fimetarium]